MSDITWITPLKWPDGWPSTQSYMRQSAGAKFGGKSPSAAGQALSEELRRLGAKNVIVTSNLEISRSGVPFASQPRRHGESPGVAVYFHLGRKRSGYAMARDAFSAPADNIASLRLAIEGLRQMQRHGGAFMLERAFAGFTALPAGESHWGILGLMRGASADDIRAAFRRKSLTAHPDSGGSADAFTRLTEARDAALREIGG